MKFFRRHEVEEVPETTRLERVLKERDYYHSEVAITPDGERIISGGASRKTGRETILVQDLLTGRIERKLEGHTNSLRYVAVTPDGAHVVSGSADGTLKIWNLASGQLERTIAVADPANKGGQSLALAMTPDGTRVVSSYTGTRSGETSHYPKGMSVWDLASGSQLRTLGIPDDDAYYLVVTPDGARVISDDGASINVWNLASGELVRKLEGHAGSIFALAVTPDGSQLVSSAEDQTVRVWDLASGSLVRTLKVPGDGHVSHLVVTPDGSRIVSGGGKMVRVWRLDSGRLECALQGSVWPKGQEYSESIHGVAVTPDGKRFISSDFLAIRIWILSPIETTESLADKLRRIKVGMTEKELTALIGQPRYVGSGAAAFALFPQMIGGVPDDVLESEPWIFDSDFGEFQVVMRKGRVVDTEAGGFGVDGLLRRVATGNLAVSEADNTGSEPIVRKKTVASGKTSTSASGQTAASPKTAASLKTAASRRTAAGAKTAAGRNTVMSLNDIEAALRKHLDRGTDLLKADELDEAIKEFVAARELRDNFSLPHFYLGVAYGRQEKWPEAIGEFERAIKLGDQDTNTFWSVGLAYSKNGQTEDAAAAFRAFLARPDAATDPSRVAQAEHFVSQVPIVREFDLR